jgi:hypothetical protein
MHGARLMDVSERAPSSLRKADGVRRRFSPLPVHRHHLTQNAHDAGESSSTPHPADPPGATDGSLAPVAEESCLEE